MSSPPRLSSENLLQTNQERRGKENRPKMENVVEENERWKRERGKFKNVRENSPKELRELRTFVVVCLFVYLFVCLFVCMLFICLSSTGKKTKNHAGKNREK